MSTSAKPSVLIVGGPDVDARLELMRHLTPDYEMGAAGSSPELARRFASTGHTFDFYPLERDVRPIADLRSLVALVRLFRRRRPDLVHTFDTKPSVWAPIAARWAGVPAVVSTVTGLGSLYGGASFTSRLARVAFETFQRVAARRTDWTVFQNHDDPTFFVERALVVNERHSVITGSGVSTNHFRPDAVSTQERAAFKAELGIERDAIVATMVSRVIRSKGVLEFAGAAADVAQTHPATRFLLVGATDEDSVDRLTHEEIARLKEHVIWPGPRSDVRTVLAASDLFVLPSTLREGVPRVLLEAASMGLPLVAVDASGCREVVRDGETGYLVPPDDPRALESAVIRLVESRERRRRFGESARGRAVAELDIGRVAMKTSDVYQRVLSSRRAGLNATR